jgi:hypothetical protein
MSTRLKFLKASPDATISLYQASGSDQCPYAPLHPANTRILRVDDTVGSSRTVFNVGSSIVFEEASRPVS